MPTTSANGIELYFDTFGEESDPTLLMVVGPGGPVRRPRRRPVRAGRRPGVRVVRYDNRDVGLSTHLHDVEVDPVAALVASMSGEPVEAPYTLSDMAADGIALLDALGVGAAHVVGTSLGGMIVQTMAIEHPDRVLSLTSIYSTTGERDVGQPDPEVLAAYFATMGPAEDRAARVAPGRGAGPAHRHPLGVRRGPGAGPQRDAGRPELRPGGVGPPDGGRSWRRVPGPSGCRRLAVPTVVLHGDAATRSSTSAAAAGRPSWCRARTCGSSRGWATTSRRSTGTAWSTASAPRSTPAITA